MPNEVGLLITTAISAGILHTLVGPDHYIPFVAMAKSGQWSYRKTLWITTLCGIGHIAGSIVLGAIGLLLGVMVMTLESVESLRGDLAGWLLIAFGISYFVWGIYRASRSVPLIHVHASGILHAHSYSTLQHGHSLEGAVKTEVLASNDSIRQPVAAPWLLFLIFIFGPCEVLIPLLMYPAAESNWFAVVAVVLAFAIATLGTMMAAVLTLSFGLRWVRLPSLHRYNHALAGAAVLMCGCAIKFGL